MSKPIKFVVVVVVVFVKTNLAKTFLIQKIFSPKNFRLPKNNYGKKKFDPENFWYNKKYLGQKKFKIKTPKNWVPKFLTKLGQ